jgi:hypothetical protein
VKRYVLLFVALELLSFALLAFYFVYKKSPSADRPELSLSLRGRVGHAESGRLCYWRASCGPGRPGTV